MSVQTALRGRQIAVTRPAGQAEALCAAIEARGGRALRFPLLAIAPVQDEAAFDALAAALDSYDLVFFVSPNAVHCTMGPVLARRSWPAGLAVATVGRGSERTLAAYGCGPVIAPDSGFDSEAVLALAEFAPAAVRGRRVLILRGDGGRDLLGETLRQRGAEVAYFTCYRRSLPDIDPQLLLQPATAHALDALSLTSSEGVRNLVALCGGVLPPALLRVPVFAAHPRIAAQARDAGFANIITTEPGDAGLLDALDAHFQSRLG